MSESLIKLTQQLNELMAMADEDGCLPDNFAEVLGKTKQKQVAVIAKIQEMECEVLALSEFIKAKQKLLNSNKVKIDSLKKYLILCMRESGDLSIKSDDGIYSAKLYVDRDESVQIVNEESIPDDYRKIISEPDKKAIKYALKEGIQIDGAYLQKKDRLQIK